MRSALIVDDELRVRRDLRALLETRRVLVFEAATAQEAITIALRERPGLILMDVRLLAGVVGFDTLGLDVVEHLREAGYERPIVVVTFLEDSRVRARADAARANELVSKDEIRGAIGRLVDDYLVESAPAPPERAPSFADLIGTSPSAQERARTFQRIARSNEPVLLTGETGAGKGFAARHLHRAGPRSTMPFVTVDCSALPATLVESELFGHERGAFTGAVDSQPGRIELAAGGTLFLDEIGDMPVDLQSRLLTALDVGGTIRRVGGRIEIPMRARIMAATHRSLEAMIAEGRFRADLFYRLNILPMHVPSLGERVEDLPTIILAFLARPEHARRIRLTAHASAWLVARPWPGNVRELHNSLRKLVALCDGPVVDLEETARIVGPPRLDSALRPTLARIDARTIARQIVDQRLPLAEVRAEVIRQTTDRCHGNKSEAARVLDLGRRVIERALRRTDGDEGAGVGTAAAGDPPRDPSDREG